MANWPRQDILEIAKDENWAKGHFLYAEDLLRANLSRAAAFTSHMNAYNGITNPMSIQYLTQTYGKINRGKYVSYRTAKTTIDLVQNDWLTRPLNSTCTTINMASKTAKLDHYETLLGASHAKEAIGKLNSVGVDPMNGMNIPDKDDKDAWDSMSFKDKNESVMQVLINSAIKDMDLKHKFNRDFQNVLLNAMCFGRNIVTIEGDDDYQSIDIRNAIYVEVEGDTFMEKSPLMGSLERMTLHDVLRKFTFTDTERNKLQALVGQVSNSYGSPIYRGRYGMMNGELTLDVIHLEWKSVRPTYYKVSNPSPNQTAVNPPDTKYRIELNTEEYEKNKLKYDKDVANGKYTIEVKYQEELWEGYQIGHEIYKDIRRKPFTMRREDAPGDVYGYSYSGMLCNTVNGYRISLQETVQAIGDAVDVVMYQILREVRKSHGKIIQYDQAMQPRKKKMTDIMHEVVNDNFLVVNSSAAGNMAGKDMATTSGIREFDMGLSQSFGALVQLKHELMATLNSISGVNPDRAGNTPASSTATNAQANIANSRLITEGWMYLMGLYVEKQLNKIAQQRKLIWGLYKPNKASIVLGDEKFAFMQVTKDLAYCDFDIKLVDGGREQQIRQRIFGLAEASLNTKELRYQDVMEMEMVETLADAKALLRKAWDDIGKRAAATAQQQQQANAEAAQQAQQTQVSMQQQMLAANRQMAIEDREDKQKQELDVIAAETSGQVVIDNNKLGKKLLLDENVIEQKALHQTVVDTNKAKNDMIVKQNQTEQNSIHQAELDKNKIEHTAKFAPKAPKKK